MIKKLISAITLLMVIFLSWGVHAQTIDTVYIFDDEELNVLVSDWEKMIVKKSPHGDNIGTLAYYDTAGILYLFAASNNLKDRIFDGECLRYRNDGTIISKEYYVNDTLDGMYYLYFDNQQVAEESEYKKDQLVSSKFYTREGKPSEVNLHSRKAIPPEGWMDIIRSNLKYPKIAIYKEIQGKVMVSFIVEKDGRLSGIKALNDPGGGLAEEAVRVVSLLPAFEPAIRDEKISRFSYRIPISFTLVVDKKRKRRKD